ncbi:LytTR family DNA-binding domain-containing protein [Galbibacter sp. EGI 63066]|uniref:LytR/AlgR family response regulator transcription factor n=1 Tax=Galbibacter sp. EGI 63066 TaxID=2993559 RepID=UPI0022489C34|nr:LytTR family DNA-binding domain-containing protein [Galbibacter sp. EGI 63066]MCX2680969.1 LytTR family DNA-binding domain-containing protein [Galbibacter sp. EGI 63066]
MNQPNLQLPGYKDRGLRIFAAVAGALMATEFGGAGDILPRLLSWRFYAEFGSSLVIALVLVELIAYVTRRLDRYYDWKKNPVPRTALQVVFGVLLPAVVDFLLAALYFRLFGMNIIEDTYYLVYAFPYIVSLILLFNLYYLVYYFILRSTIFERKVRQLRPVERNTGGGGRKRKEKEVFVVSSGAKNIPVPVEGIGYFYHDQGHNYLCTFEGKRHLVTWSLNKLEGQLSRERFFRVNRKMIVNYKACKHFEPARYGKLELFLEPEAEIQPVIVSQGRARRFKEWVER